MRTSSTNRPAATPGNHHNEEDTSIAPAPRYRLPREPALAARLAPFVLLGSSGSQARAILAQALINARRRNFEVIAVSRDAGAFAQQPLHEMDIHGVRQRTLSLSPDAHPYLRLLPARDSGRIPGEARVFNSVVAHALLDSVSQLPEGVKIFTGQNCVPNRLPPEKKFQRQHYVSTIASRNHPASHSATVTQGGFLHFDARSPDRHYLEAVLGGGEIFTLKFVPDIRAHQWRKISASVASNTLCTLFNVTFGQLHQRTENDPRCLALVRGLLGETRAVATARGIDPGTIEDLHQNLRHMQQSWPAHRSSMHHALVSGHTTENAYLAAAIAQESDARGLEAPLCHQAALAIERYVARRDQADRLLAPKFYEDNQALVSKETEALLALAGSKISNSA